MKNETPKPASPLPDPKVLLPFRHEKGTRRIIAGQSCRVVATVGDLCLDSTWPLDCATADYIVHACNNFPALVKALEAVVAEFDEWEGPEEPERNSASRARNRNVRAYESARAALAAAKGVQP